MDPSSNYPILYDMNPVYHSPHFLLLDGSWHPYSYTTTNYYSKNSASITQPYDPESQQRYKLYYFQDDRRYQIYKDSTR